MSQFLPKVEVPARVQMDLVVSAIREYARDYDLTAEQIETIFHAGIVSCVESGAITTIPIEPAVCPLFHVPPESLNTESVEVRQYLATKNPQSGAGLPAIYKPGTQWGVLSPESVRDILSRPENEKIIREFLLTGSKERRQARSPMRLMRMGRRISAWLQKLTASAS